MHTKITPNKGDSIEIPTHIQGISMTSTVSLGSNYSYHLPSPKNDVDLYDNNDNISDINNLLSPTGTNTNASNTSNTKLSIQNHITDQTSSTFTKTLTYSYQSYGKTPLSHSKIDSALLNAFSPFSPTISNNNNDKYEQNMNQMSNDLDNNPSNNNDNNNSDNGNNINNNNNDDYIVELEPPKPTKVDMIKYHLTEPRKPPNRRLTYGY